MNEYSLADRAIALLKKKAIRRFEDAKSKAAGVKFDELNVLGICKKLYAALESDNFKTFLELAIKKYLATEPHGDKEPDDEWLMEYLEYYDPVTKYVYENEVERKRDRLAEAVNASREKAKEFTKGLGYWVQMTAHYADDVSDKATIKAFKDAGITRVMWHTVTDNRVCEDCEDRDGTVYDIDNIPPKPHWGCRCYLTPVRSNKQKFKSN
jgi:SPP1 gp7 family putative phage head morphogenesis protein